jgi:hypothetical protein
VKELVFISRYDAPEWRRCGPGIESSMTKRVKRRIFLRGLGGACVAAPYLGSIVDREAQASSVDPPKRLIGMFTHYGCITTRFFPEKSHGVLSAADLEQTTLRHLAPYVDKLLMPRGMRAMNEWTVDMARGQGNDPYLQIAGSYFTCQPVTPHSDDPFSFDSATKFQAKPVGPSLDHVIAKQLSPGGVPLFVRVGNFNDSPASAVSYSAAETGYAGVGLPSQLFASLTGLFPDGPLSPDSYQASRGQSVVDLVRDDLETLERFDMSASDRNTLEVWKELLHDTTQVMAPATCNGDLANALQLTQANVDAAGSRELTQDILTTKLNDTFDVADLYSHLAVLAAVCQLNPVILLKYPATYVFKGLGIEIESTSLSHRANNASMTGTCYPNAIDHILAIDDFYARKFANLVDVLSRIDEGDGKLIDNTAAVWFQEVSDGCARNLNNLPIVQAGSLGGYFKTGWAVNVADGSPDLTRGNSEAQCTPETTNEYDATTQETGTDPSIANAPINKYFCNLMNALGVKAGEDGFPLAGGAAEVTKFGRYDRTEDFATGGSEPPMIHDPGEFRALKADG